MAQGESSHFRVIQGHPWWATGTGDLAHYVSLQMEFSAWRLLDFVESIYGPHFSSPTPVERNKRDYVACIEQMSPVEIDFYFSAFSQWLLHKTQNKTGLVPLCLLGTYDSQSPPQLSRQILRTVAVVHLGIISNEPFGGGKNKSISPVDDALFEV